MAEKKKPRKGLGKGLDALLPLTSEPAEPSGAAQAEGVQTAKVPPSGGSAAEDGAVTELKMLDIEPNPKQPRKQFDEEKLEELTESIRQHGLIQPLLVKAQGNGRYLIIAGERRWRAAKRAGLKTAPCIVRDYTEQEVMEIALIENLQREDLNPIEEAEGYQELIEEFGLTQESVSERVGKSRSAVANALRLNRLPDLLKEMLSDGRLTSGHARALIPLPTEEMQLAAAQRVVDGGLNVRQTETLAARLKADKPKKPQPEPSKELQRYYAEAEKKISSRLGTKVKIHEGGKKGKIEIEYYTREDLERLLEELS